MVVEETPCVWGFYFILLLLILDIFYFIHFRFLECGWALDLGCIVWGLLWVWIVWAQWSHVMWDLSSLNQDGTASPVIESSRFLATGPIREVLQRSFTFIGLLQIWDTLGARFCVSLRWPVWRFDSQIYWKWLPEQDWLLTSPSPHKVTFLYLFLCCNS